MSEIRYDLLRDQYVLITPERLRQPDYTSWIKPESKGSESCPLCEGQESLTPPEIFAIRGNRADRPGWQTRVIPNLYKAVQIETPNRSRRVGIYDSFDGCGAHEIIVDTPRHLERMDEWSEAEIINWLKTIQTRLTDLRKDIRLKYVTVFKNHGHYAGAMQGHPHTQIIALPIVPKAKVNDIRRSAEYYRAHGRCIIEDVVATEMEEKKRIIGKNEEFVAFCPYASAFPFEVVIASSRSIPSLDRFNAQAIKLLAGLIKDTMGRMYEQLGNFHFNLVVNTPPLQESFELGKDLRDITDVCKFYIRIMPRIYRLGGFEFSTMIFQNPVAPEHAAALMWKERS